MIQFHGTSDLASIRKYLTRHIRPDRIIEADIFASPGLGGDSAFDFIETFAAEFGVDLSAYDWALYHHDEAEMLMARWQAQILYRLRRDRPDPDRAFFHVSLQHLGDVAEAGRWYAPPGPPRMRPWPAFWRTALQWLSGDTKAGG